MGARTTGSAPAVYCAFWTYLGLVSYAPGVGKPQPLGQIQPSAFCSLHSSQAKNGFYIFNRFGKNKVRIIYCDT